MLCELDNEAANQVFYAAPRFHRVEEFDAAYLAQAVVERSFCIRPRDIGVFADDGDHHVVFDNTRHFVCLDVREVPGFRGREFFEQVRKRLEADRRSLRQGVVANALEVVERVISRRGLRRSDLVVKISLRTEEERQLRRLADLSLRFFGTQLFIVQPTPEAG